MLSKRMACTLSSMWSDRRAQPARLDGHAAHIVGPLVPCVVPLEWRPPADPRPLPPRALAGLREAAPHTGFQRSRVPQQPQQPAPAPVHGVAADDFAGVPLRAGEPVPGRRTGHTGDRDHAERAAAAAVAASHVAAHAMPRRRSRRSRCCFTTTAAALASGPLWWECSRALASLTLASTWASS